MKTRSPSWRLLSLLAGAMLAGNASAGVITLLDENFDDVTRSASNLNPLIDTSVRTIRNILNNTPTQLDGSGSADYWKRSFSGTAALGRESSFNVRAANNSIDDSFIPLNDFDNFFNSQFLVIGDDDDDGLFGTPNGGIIGNGSLMTLSFNFGSLATFSSIKVSFAYVFDANNLLNSDDFVVSLTDDGSNSFKLIEHLAPGAGTRNSTFSQEISIASLSFVPTTLRFSLTEYAELGLTGSSAVGLDNLKVEAVPEPTSLALLGVGLVGLGFLRRRKTA